MTPVQPVTAVTAAARARRSGESWRDAWHTALHAAELDVVAAEELITRLHLGDDDDVPAPDVDDWVAPGLPGPVPEEFADRARRLLQRQLDVAERLAEAMVHARSQRRVLAKLDRAERPPVFVDRAL